MAEIEAIPQAEIQEFCAGIVLHFAERFRKERQGKKTQEVNSLGVSAITGLYRFGSEKRRWYDGLPMVQKMAGLFYSMSAEGMQWVNEKLGDTLGLLRIYAQVCEEIRQPISQVDISRICMTALQDGAAEAQQLLVGILGPSGQKALKPKPDKH